MNEKRKIPEKWELDLIFYINRLLIEYGKVMDKEDKVYKGKYPSPFDKAQGDILKMVAKELSQQREEVIKKTIGLCRAYMQDHTMADAEFSVAIYKLEKQSE